MKIYIYALLVWFILAVLGIVNGTIKNEFYGSAIGEQKAHVLSSVIAIGYISLITHTFLNHFFNWLF